MKSLSLIIFGLLFFCFSLKAEDRVHERVYVHTDKNCYVAGEDILLKFYVINSNFQPSSLSKVGYIEICNTEKHWMQLEVALEKGSGAGKIKIPTDVPSGIYRLSGYTLYMRNEGESAFFSKQIAIVNVEEQVPDSNRFKLVEKFENIQSPEKRPSKENEAIHPVVKTDQSSYNNRSKVVLSLDDIPDNAADLVISVSRNDSIAKVPEINDEEWLTQVSDTFPFSRQWLPEYEGKIISGRFVPEPKEPLQSSLVFVGNDIRYFCGKEDTLNGTINFYTAGIFGKQQIVTSAVSLTYNNVPYRIDLLNPFSDSLPCYLPVLQICPNEKQLMERYIGVQIREKMENDSLNNSIQLSRYCNFQPIKTYDLDQYTRFSTISETLLEFVYEVRVSKVEGKRRIKVFMNDGLGFNYGNTLVLLDGVPVYDHEDIFKYNPMYIKIINIYNEKFLFGSNFYEGIVSFVTREGNLPFFKLSDGSQLFNYDCPQLPPSFENPDYSIDSIKNSRKPDFRHTLYWNPFVKSTNGQPVNLSFYTSDLCGEFKVAVEGITTDGKIIHGASGFRVIASK